jgi:CBS domain containing-hemolysin-like protein
MSSPYEGEGLRRTGATRAQGWMGSLRGLLRRVGVLKEGRMARAGEANQGAADAAAELVDHAEAFQSLRVADVMTPRADITAVEISTPFEAVVAAFAESEHSRLPVYRESLDDPVGVAHLKDVFKQMARKSSGAAPSPEILDRLKRETLYVPPSMRAADLLVRMKASRIHMAMVIDEFGGVDGLVTLEDVIEAVVGEIDDEHDEAAATQILARAGGVYEVDARVSLEELEAALGRDLAAAEIEDDIDTAAGLVTALAGRVPQRGEVIVHPAGLEFEITDADPRRIKRLRVRPALPDRPLAETAPPSDG